jgi:hypothetical protein
VGTAVPSFAHWLFAIACYVVTGIQLIGFLGVYKVCPINLGISSHDVYQVFRPQESLKSYKFYQRTNTLAVIVAFGIAAAFIGLSAGRHNTAVTNCKNAYFQNTSSSTSSESQTLCNIFTWVGVGLMGLLWVVLAIFQVCGG